MRWWRLLLGTLGMVVLAAGLTIAGEGPLRELVGNAVQALGNDYFFVAVLAVVGVVIAAGMLVSGRSGNLEQTAMPDPERPTAVPAPGDEFDDRVRSLRFKLPLVGRSVRRRVRTRLRTAAVDATLHADGCSRREAQRRIEAGTWTDDRDAAAFLSEDDGAVARHLTTLFDGETLGQRRARRTVAEIAARTRTRGGD